MTSCADVLAGRAPKDAPVTLKGWVRTRRDSKAGFSFIHLSDGSSFRRDRVWGSEPTVRRDEMLTLGRTG